ncbi:hypothetical protein ACWENQ_08480 [Nonomuraea sp. NPDC004354]
MTQLVLFKPREATQKPAPEWGVWLSEIGMTAVTPDVMTWWIPYRHRFETSGKVRVLDAIVPGEIIEIGPYTGRDDAEFLAEYLVSQGVHPKHLKVRRWVS